MKTLIVLVMLVTWTSMAWAVAHVSTTPRAEPTAVKNVKIVAEK